MTINSYQFILDNMTSAKDSIKASKIYIEHQLGLPENLRVCHEDENILQEQLDHLKIQLIKYVNSIKELIESRKILTAGSGTD